MAKTDYYGEELRAQFARATARGMTFILVNARDLQASFGDFTSSNSELVSCRLAMRSEMNSTDVVLVADNTVAGLTVRFALPRVVS